MLRQQPMSSHRIPIKFALFLGQCEQTITVYSIQMSRALLMRCRRCCCRCIINKYDVLHHTQTVCSSKTVANPNERVNKSEKNQQNINTKFDTSLSKRNDLYLWAIASTFPFSVMCHLSFAIPFFARTQHILLAHHLQDYNGVNSEALCLSLDKVIVGAMFFRSFFRFLVECERVHCSWKCAPCRCLMDSAFFFF